MPIKSRYFAGSSLTAFAIAAAIYLDIIGSTEKPEPLVVNFSRSTTLSNGERERLIVFSNKYSTEERLMFNVLGHTGERGDTEANLALSQQRAEVVAQLLESAGVENKRILSVEGVGSADPLPANPDLSDSALQRSMSRVVITPVVRK